MRAIRLIVLDLFPLNISALTYLTPGPNSLLLLILQRLFPSRYMFRYLPIAINICN